MFQSIYSIEDLQNSPMFDSASALHSGLVRFRPKKIGNESRDCRIMAAVANDCARVVTTSAWGCRASRTLCGCRLEQLPHARGCSG